VRRLRNQQTCFPSNTSPQFAFPLRPVLPFLLNKKPPVEYFIPPETPETPETLETLETLETVSHLD
jgi:hypothetical protein